MNREQFFRAVRQYAALARQMGKSFDNQILAAHDLYVDGLDADAADYSEKLTEASRLIEVEAGVFDTRPPF